MTVPFLDLRRRFASLGPELHDALADVIAEGPYVGGPRVEAFELEFAAFCGARAAVGVASGTDAIELALRALGVGEGDEVITAANTCVPTIAGIVAAGATPVLVDVDERTFTLDPEELDDATTVRTKAVVAVHLYGRCADTGRIAEHAREHGLAVVEDAAQAHGASLDGRRAGTLGAVAAFSFYPTKNLGALGDAGAVVTDDEAVAVAVRELRSFGERRGGEAVRCGSNSRLDPLQAAVLSVELPRLEGWNDRRRELAARYCAELADVVRVPDQPAGGGHAHHLFVIRSPHRDALARALERSGVGTLVHYPRAVHEHPAYHGLARPGRLARSERFAREVLSLPLYPELTDDEVARVIAAVRGARDA